MSNDYGFLVNNSNGNIIIDTTLYSNVTLLDVVQFDADYWSKFDAKTLDLKYMNGSTALPTPGNFYVVQDSELNTVSSAEILPDSFLMTGDSTVIKKTYNLTDASGTNATFNYNDVIIRIMPVNRALLDYNIKNNILTIYIIAQVLQYSAAIDYSVLTTNWSLMPEEIEDLNLFGKTITLRVGLR